MSRTVRSTILPVLLLAVLVAGCSSSGPGASGGPSPAPSPSPSPSPPAPEDDPTSDYSVCLRDVDVLLGLLSDWVSPWQRAYDVNEGAMSNAEKARVMRTLAARFERLRERLAETPSHRELVRIRKDMRASFTASAAGWRANADAWATSSPNKEARKVLDTAADRWEDARDALAGEPCEELA